MTERRILVGRIGSPYGVRGNLKVISWTDPLAAIFSYQPWIITSEFGHEMIQPKIEGRQHGQHLIAVIPDVTDRDQASALRGSSIHVPRSALPPLGPNAYYWADLEGLRVSTLAGQVIGYVSYVFATGANDVLVVRGVREHMIPFVIPDVVRSVDLEQGLIRIDWDPSF